MISMGLSTRIRLTVVIIVGAFAIDLCRATATTTAAAATIEADTIKQNDESTKREESTFSSSLDSPVSEQLSLFSSTPPYSEDEIGTGSMNEEVMLSEYPESRLMPDSDESGILLPFEDDFPHPGASKARLLSGNVNMEELPQAVTFPGKPISLRVTGGKALNQPGKDDEAATYYIRNNCFGPRCNRHQRQQNSEKIPLNSPEEWKNMLYSSKEIKSKKYDDGGGRTNRLNTASHKLEENVLESMSSNYHSQVAIPFVVVDDKPRKDLSQSMFSRRNGIPDRFSRLTASTNVPATTEGWVKLKAISPDAYDPFRLSRNQSASSQSTFSKRDSSQQASNNFSKRVGVELNPESFADRWGGWGSNNNNNDDNRGGSRLPAWLEEQLKYGSGNGNRNSDQGKNWVKLDPIPVAGVTISKWVPKGTSSHELPTTTWQNNRDRPNGGSQWWDRIDDNRILSGSRPSSPFLRPNGNSGNNNRFPDSGGGGGGWGGMGGSKVGGGAGSPLSSFDRYPTNSWNDIIYPEGPTSATVSWQQNKGISSYPSSFGSGGGGGGGGGENSGGWSSGSDTRKPIVATGSWSAPPSNNRFPSFINRFNDHRPTNYPVKQASEDDPRWVLISNTRRVTGGGPSGNRGNDFDRNKVLSYINRLHPDLDRQADFPYYERAPTSHRHGKDFWPFPKLGPSSTADRPSKDEAFHRLNATLSTLTPILLHRSGTTVRPPVVGTLSPSSPEFAEILGLHEGSSNSDSDSDTDFMNSISSTLSPLLSTYIGDGRGTSSNAATLYQSSTSIPVRNFMPSRFTQGFKNINPVYAAVGAGMIPATLAAVMPMMLGRRKRRDVTNFSSHPKFKYYYADTKTGFLSELGCCKILQY